MPLAEEQLTSEKVSQKAKLKKKKSLSGLS